MRVTDTRGPPGNFPPQQEPPSLLKRITAFVASLFSRKEPVTPEQQKPLVLSNDAMAVIKKLEENEYKLSDDDKKSIDEFCAAVKDQQKEREEKGSHGRAVAAVFTIGKSFKSLLPLQLTVLDDGQNIHVIIPDKQGKKLGQGNYGVVAKAIKLAGNEQPLVVKKPPGGTIYQIAEANSNLVHEGRILSTAYKDVDPSKVIGLPHSTALAYSKFYMRAKPKNEYDKQAYTTIIEKDPKTKKFILPEEDTRKKLTPAKPEREHISTYLLSQQYDGDLISYLGSKPTTQQLLSVFAQSAQGLAFLHGKNIAHKDMKPDNILVRTLDNNGKNEAVITDFGSAVLLDAEEIEKSDWSYSETHTPAYTFLAEQHEYVRLANAIIETKKDINDPSKEADKEKNLAKLKTDMEAFQQLNKQQDVFAFCYLIVLSTRTSDKITINGNPVSQNNEYIKDIEVLPGLEKALTDKGLSPDAAKLIIQGLNKNREERPSAEQLADAISPYL